MGRIKVGIITAPVGIKGEVRVYPYTDEMTRFSDIKKLYCDGQDMDVLSVRYQKNMVVLSLSGIADRNKAEAMRQKELFLDESQMWDVPSGTYFVKDLIGMAVYTPEGDSLGTLTDVIQNGRQDLYEITDNHGQSFLVPAVEEFVKAVDVQERRMTVHLIEGLMDL